MREAYELRRAAQVVAFFAIKAGGSINVLRLAKLLYLGDREHMDRHDMPILFDKFVSMDNGPVTSTTLNYINGLSDNNQDWSDFVSARSGHQIRVARRDIEVDDLDELSDADIETLESVWTRFRSMGRFALAQWTHDNCDEWEDPEGTSLPIPYRRVLRALGKEQPDAILESLDEVRGLSRSPS